MTASDPLLQPLQLRHLTLRNRVMSTAHAPSYVEDGLPRQRYQLYHEEKAKGGLALTMFGGSSSVAADSPSSFGQIDISQDRIIPVLQEFAARIHAHGCALMIQLTHAGRRTRWDTGDWLPNVSASPLREYQHRSTPKEMEVEDIQRVQRQYGDAAWRAKEGGLDGLEVISEPEIDIGPAESRWVVVRLQIPYGSAAPGSHTVYFDVRAQDDKGQVAEKSVFLVPR